ncbi:hypothetical protein I317_01632 [Kwoniella heveanensis CBS 569]|nr:hypothetical protein I317_01632 [Kwoniella heveanensis CBS 569]
MSVAPLNHLFSPEFEARLLELMMQTHTPGCGVSLVGGHDDGTWEEVVKVYGTAKDDQPVTPDTRFPIASNTKLFTVLALAELLEKHALTFETRIKDILPEFQLVDKVTENLSTINDFCCHMTGIPGYSFAYAKGLTREDVLELFRSHQPSTSFRQTMGFQYNNQAYDILGLVIERLSGVSYTDYIRQTFFEPLGMRTAGFGWDEHTATGHWTGRRGDTVEIPGAVTGVPACQSSGGVVASAVDMVKWLKFIASHPGYQQASTPRSIDHGWADVWNFPYSSSVTTYGAGLFQCTYHDTSVHEHWGALNGFRVILSWVPSAKVGMFIVVNGYQGEDILNLLKMTVLDRVTGGVEHGTDEWLKR